MTVGLGRAARSVEEYGYNMGALMQVLPQGQAPFAARPDDVFISSWAKSGTTLMQQMFHQLRMGAATGAPDMDFDDISRMTPWEDTVPLTGCDLDADQRAHPRGFKSHREYDRLPAGSRYVVVLRDPHETYVSMHRFFEGWQIEPGAISLEDFWPLWLGGGPGGCDYFTHLLSWYPRRDAPDTLLATYRATVKDRRAMIRRLAGFLGIALTPELEELVYDHTSREFMHAHKDRFDDAMICRIFEEKLGIPADSDSSKVQAEGSDATTVPPAIAARIDALWATRILPATGHTTFASLARELESR